MIDQRIITDGAYMRSVIAINIPPGQISCGELGFLL